MAQWCNPLTLQPEQSGGVGSRRGRASPLEHHDEGSRTRLALSYFCDPSAWCQKPQLHLHLHQSREEFFGRADFCFSPGCLTNHGRQGSFAGSLQLQIV